MNFKRYLFVLLLGSAAGALWAWLFVDWPPKWYDNSGAGMHAAVIGAPFILHLVCGLAFRWWRWPAAAAYALIVGLWSSIGAAVNEAAFGCACCRGEPWTSKAGSVLTLALVSGAFLLMAWALARGLRRLAARRWKPEADSFPSVD